MGYFKKPIRRGVAKTAKQAFVEEAAGVDFGPWKACAGEFSADADRYVRFVILQRTGRTVGLFRGIRSIDSAEELSVETRSRLRTTFRWFKKELPVPRRLPRTAICWFRSDATVLIEAVRDLVEVYREAGLPVLMQATRAPGRIVYQDEWQVAAVPYRDRRKTSTEL